MVIGDEILSGKRTDQHFSKTLELLRLRGLSLGWARYLPDDRALIADALRTSLASSDVVFSFGGIGSTPDDHTRQAAAAALGRPLVLHPEAAHLIAARCAELAAAGRGSADMTTAENRQRLTMGEFPAGAQIIPNPYNGIPGFTIGQHWFFPGFPVMGWPMLEWVLDTHFRPYFNAAPTAERSLLVFETAESAIVPLMERIEQHFPTVKAFSLPSVGDGRDGRLARRHIELGVKGPAADVEAALELMRAGLAVLGAEFSSAP
jgi:molybdopterin-biosynthesis enzyme MoeA-like protein